MMRKLILVGDPPSTGGVAQPHGVPYVGGVGGTDHTIIGGTVFCVACNSVGLIAKAGGPSRRKGNHREIALEGDILLCRCAAHPVMVSKSSVSWHPKHDDQIESLGAYAAHEDQGGGMKSHAIDGVDFNDYYRLVTGSGQFLASVAYAIERETGAIEYGETDGNGRTHLLSSVVVSENINIYFAG